MSTPASRGKKILPPVIASVAFVAAWQMLVILLDLAPYLLPSPVAVFSEIRHQADQLFTAFLVTGAAACGGLFLSVITGTAVAFLFAEFRLVRRALFPYAVFLQTVPIVAIAPLIVIWLGTGIASIVAVSFLVSVFPIVTAGTTGLAEVPDELRELFALHDASRSATFWKLRLPCAIPYLAAGLRVSGGLSVVGAIVGEFFAGFGAEEHGLGYLILTASSQLKTPLLFATILASTALGVSFFAIAGWSERAVTSRWKDSGEVG